LIRAIWSQTENISLPDRFNVMTYHEAMCRVKPTNFSVYAPDRSFPRISLAPTSRTRVLL
jgi:aspartyl-tRNA synthetase